MRDLIIAFYLLGMFGTLATILFIRNREESLLQGGDVINIVFWPRPWYKIFAQYARYRVRSFRQKLKRA